MKKFGFILMTVFILCACSSLTVTVKEDITIEYGSELKIEDLTDQEGIKLKEVKEYDAKKIGEQTITAVFTDASDKEIEQEVILTVKDTKKPEITLNKDKVEITAGDKFDAKSNVKSVKDPVDGDLKYSDKKDLVKNGYQITGSVDTKKAGNYKLKVVAYDKNGNKVEKEFTVKVKEKPKEEAAQPSNQPSGNTYSNNSGSTTSNKPTVSGGNAGSSSKPVQAKPQQTCSGYGKNAIGNSGKVFNSEQEAIDYGYQMQDNDEKILSFGYGQVYDKCDNILNQWTVDFNYGGNFTENPQ